MSERTHPFTREQMLVCARRELALRRAVYPRRVADNKMRQEEADREIDTMEAIALALEQYPLQCYAAVAVRVVVQDFRNRGGFSQLIDAIETDEWTRIEACMVAGVKDNVVYKRPVAAAPDGQEFDFA